MTFLIKVKMNGTAYTNTIETCEVLQRTYTATASAGYFLYTTTTKTEIDKLLNDYAKVIASVSGTTLTLDFVVASSDISARKIESTAWKTKVRPALLRAATTTSMFNL